jgi:hypothetical protein
LLNRETRLGDLLIKSIKESAEERKREGRPSEGSDRAAGGTSIDVAPVVGEAGALLTPQQDGYDRALQSLRAACMPGWATREAIHVANALARPPLALYPGRLKPLVLDGSIRHGQAAWFSTPSARALPPGR